MNFFNNINMRLKMFSIYIFAVLIPFFVVAVIYAQNTNKEFERQAMEVMSSRSHNFAQNINSSLMGYNTLANLWANNEDFRNKIEKKYEGIMDALDLYQDLWNQYDLNLHSWSGMKNITIYTENETMGNSYPYLIRSDTYFKDMPEYEEILSVGATGRWYGNRKGLIAEYWSPKNINEKGDGDVFSYNRAIFSRDNISIPIGVITIEIHTNPLVKLIENEENIEVFLLDNSNDIVVSNAQWKPEYAQALDKENDGLPIKIAFDGYSSFADSSEIYNGWKIVSIISLEEAMKNFNTIKLYSFWLLLLITVVISILIFFFSKQISNRSNKLLSKMEMFMGKEMKIDNPLGGKDEFGLIDEEFSALATKLKQSIDDTYILQLQKNKFHLQTLQMQIKPHFLYNTLSTIAWLSDSSPRDEIRGAVENLAKFYRVSLSNGRDIISLREEIKGVKAYLEIQKLRFNGRINVYYQIDENFYDALIPKLTLQPLIENCIRHGLSGTKEIISIMVQAVDQNGKLKIIIQDDGVGMTKEEVAALVSGTIKSDSEGSFGFKNISERISLYFGESHGLEVESKKNVGTAVTIVIPFVTEL